MSKEQQVPITCPECKTTHPFTKYDSVNTKIDPGLKDAVKYGSLFEFKCPSCGAKTTVDYGLLYHQMEDRIMIFYVTSDEEAEKTRLMILGNPHDPSSLMMQKMRQNNHYLMRIVRSQNELREKIMILDDGLDDRIVELFKEGLASKLKESDPTYKEVNVLYYSNETGRYLQFFVNRKPYKTMEFPYNNYKNYCDLLGIDDLPDMRADGPFIDRQYALEILDKAPLSNRNRLTKNVVTATQQTGCLLPIISILVLCVLLFTWI